MAKFKLFLTVFLASACGAQTWNTSPHIYKYSVVPGGIWSQEAAHDLGIDARIAQLRHSLARYVSYAKDDGTYWTSEPLTIQSREYVWVTENGQMVRARCGNSLSALAHVPRETHPAAPRPEEFDDLAAPIPVIDLPMPPFFAGISLPPQTTINGYTPSLDAVSSSGEPPWWLVAPIAAYPLAVGGYLTPTANTVTAPVPEPSTLGLVGLGFIAALLCLHLLKSHAKR